MVKIRQFILCCRVKYRLWTVKFKTVSHGSHVTHDGAAILMYVTYENWLPPCKQKQTASVMPCFRWYFRVLVHFNRILRKRIWHGFEWNTVFSCHWRRHLSESHSRPSGHTWLLPRHIVCSHSWQKSTAIYSIHDRSYISWIVSIDISSIWAVQAPYTYYIFKMYMVLVDSCMELQRML